MRSSGYLAREYFIVRNAAYYGLVRRETVADAAHGLDQLVVSGLGESAAQTADMHVDSAVLDEHAVAPDPIQYLAARMHALRVGHEVMQQAEFGRPQIQRSAVAGNAMGGRIEAQAADLDRVVGHLRCAAAQHSLDAGIELARAERLGDVVVGTYFQPRTLSASRRERSA